MKIFILFILSIFSVNILAGINIRDRIQTRNFMLKRYDAVFSEKIFSYREAFKVEFQKTSQFKKARSNELIKRLDKHIPEKILMPLVYWSTIKPNKQKVKEVLEYYFLYKLLILRDYIDHPFTMDKERALNILRDLADSDSLTTNDLFLKSKENISKNAKKISQLLANTNRMAKSILNLKIVVNHFEDSFTNFSDYLLSYIGFIGGNTTKLFSENTRDMSRINWFNNNAIIEGGKLDFNQSYMQMPNSNNIKGHPSFNDPIFKKIRDLIIEAKESIFIDIFLFGGTMGGTLAKFILDQTKLKLRHNPKFKLLILHDYATNYNMKDELMPIFNYINNRINSDSDLKANAFLLQSNIQRHPAGIPFGITTLIPRTPAVFKVIEQKNTYFESKIDHSKVVVIDANTELPKAYFGSKNWSDHSGGYYFDNVIYVEGPAAAAVQSSYVEDIRAALTTNKDELSWFYFKEQNLDNRKYLPIKEKIISYFTIKKSSYPSKGGEIVRMAEGNVDAKVKNVRNILVDMIKHAQKNIYMEQLFLYDSYIVDALIKRKIEKPSLDVKILIDNNENFGLNGLPNTLFVKEMKKYKIQIKSRILLGTHYTFLNGTQKTYHQELHRKIISIDGRVMLGGSSNINPDTLQGSFREFGAQIFNINVIKKFENRFISDWHDNSQTQELDIENFQAFVGGKSLSVKISAFINNLGSHLYRNKDFLEKRR